MTAPAVSVIVPTRNRPGLLAGALRSVLAQGWQDFDVWVVDDASTPAVELPADAAGDPRVALLRLARHAGRAGARNHAARRSRAPVLAFLDDDDRWRPGFLARMVSALRDAPPGVALAHAGVARWDGARLVDQTVPRPGADLRRRLLEHPCFPPSAVVVRRDSFERAGGFDASLGRTEDWDLWLRLFDGYGDVAVPEVLCDQAVSDAPPEELLRWFNELVARLGPRLASLPPRERRRVEARHLFDTGVLLARCGRPGEARAALWRSWRRWPRSVRPLAHLGVTVTGAGR